MAKTISINLPLTQKIINSLHAGDAVELNGTIYSARDAAHRRLVDDIKKKKPGPFPIRGSTIYYMGPSPARPGKAIGAAGPTTSGRMDAYAPLLLAKGLKGMVGKGKRSEECARAIKKFGAVYFIATGGAGALIAQSIQSAEITAYSDLGPEAVRKLEVAKFPCLVGIDRCGKSILK
jgi:fumarate hydratase subunit beta